MGNLGSLLSKGSGTSAPDNSDANTTQSDANANVTSETPRANPDAVDNATLQNFDDENNTLTGDNQGLSPDHNLVGREHGGDRSPKLIATCLPIQRFKIGRFQFEKGVLNLYEDSDVSDFRKLLEGLPPVDRNQIKIIDREAAERLVRPVEPGATKQFDSSVGRQRETLATGDKVIGDQPLDGTNREQFAKRAQTDNNIPVTGTDDKNVVNELNRGDVQSDDQIKDQQAANTGGNA